MRHYLPNLSQDGLAARITRIMGTGDYVPTDASSTVETIVFYQLDRAVVGELLSGAQQVVDLDCPTPGIPTRDLEPLVKKLLTEGKSFVVASGHGDSTMTIEWSIKSLVEKDPTTGMITRYADNTAELCVMMTLDDPHAAGDVHTRIIVGNDTIIGRYWVDGEAVEHHFTAEDCGRHILPELIESDVREFLENRQPFAAYIRSGDNRFNTVWSFED